MDAHAGIADGGDGTAPDVVTIVAGNPACTAGGDCMPSECQAGTWVCVDGGRVCQEVAALEAGTPCTSAGDDAGAHVCSGGQCVACNAGGDCSDPSTPCIKKSYDCSSGSAQCTAAGTVADGLPCNGTLYCYGGVCSACQVGSSCPPTTNACHVGKVTACTNGTATCTDQGTSAPPGSSCTAAGSVSGVCDGAGNCAACSPGAQCNPNGNPCQLGTQACTGGAQCANVQNVREGQPCGTGTSQVCHGGACVACDGTSCASGCCDSTGCVTTAQTPSECGAGAAGSACTSCSGPTAGAGSAVCVNNACGLACSSSTPTICGTACVICTGGQACVSSSSQCACASGTLGGKCVSSSGCAGATSNCDAGCATLPSPNCGLVCNGVSNHCSADWGGCQVSGGSGVAVDSQTIYAMQFTVPNVTVDGLDTRMTTSVMVTGSMGIYTDVSGHPSTLLPSYSLNVAFPAGGNGGGVGLQPVALCAGTYWIAMTANFTSSTTLAPSSGSCAAAAYSYNGSLPSSWPGTSKPCSPMVLNVSADE